MCVKFMLAALQTLALTLHYISSILHSASLSQMNDEAGDVQHISHLIGSVAEHVHEQ